MSLFGIFLIFLLGTAVGSFLNVVIDRLPDGRDIIKGRSKCDYCKRSLSPLELIPLLSFILQGGKSRCCGKKLSWQYPIVEFTSGIIFVLAYLYNLQFSIHNSQSIFNFPINQLTIGHFTFYINLAYMLFVLCSLLVIFVIDLKHRIIPDEILLVNIPVVIINLLFIGLSRSNTLYPLPLTLSPSSGLQLLISHFLSGLSLSLLFLFLVLITRGRGMGLGDVKFAFLMGLILGFPGTVVAFYLSFLTGAVISLILVMKGKKRMKSTIPFGPFLAVSTAVSLLYGQEIWGLMVRMMGL